MAINYSLLLVFGHGARQLSVAYCCFHFATCVYTHTYTQYSFNSPGFTYADKNSSNVFTYIIRVSFGRCHGHCRRCQKIFVIPPRYRDPSAPTYFRLKIANRMIMVVQTFIPTQRVSRLNSKISCAQLPLLSLCLPFLVLPSGSYDARLCAAKAKHPAACREAHAASRRDTHASNGLQRDPSRPCTRVIPSINDTTLQVRFLFRRRLKLETAERIERPTTDRRFFTTILLFFYDSFSFSPERP